MAKKPTTSTKMTNEVISTEGVSPEAVPQETPPAPKTPEKPKASAKPKAAEKSKKKINKRVAFEEAITNLGADAKPLQLQEWIRKRYGAVLKTSLLSTYKSTWLREQENSPRGRVPAPGTPRSRSSLVASAGSKEHGAESATLRDIRVLREMLQRVGESQLREMLDLLGVR